MGVHMCACGGPQLLFTFLFVTRSLSESEFSLAESVSKSQGSSCLSSFLLLVLSANSCAWLLFTSVLGI